MWSIDMLVHLRAFVAVAELESFSGAADELSIGQPLLSRRIKSLEIEIGADLFDRSKRQIAITQVGRALLEPAKSLIARADLFESVVRSTLGSDRFRLGIPPECDPRQIARIVTAASESGQLIDVVELPTMARELAFADGALEAALLRGPADAADFTVKLGLAAGRRIESAGHEVVHLEDLRRRRGDPAPARRILLSAEDDTAAFFNALERAATRAGLARGQLETVASGSGALVRVLAGEDVLLCSRQLAERHGLVWMPLADPAISRTYRLAAARAVEKNARLIEFVRRLTPLLGLMLDAVRSGAPGRRVVEPSGADANAAAHPLVEGWR